MLAGRRPARLTVCDATRPHSIVGQCSRRSWSLRSERHWWPSSSFGTGSSTCSTPSPTGAAPRQWLTDAPSRHSWHRRSATSTPSISSSEGDDSPSSISRSDIHSSPVHSEPSSVFASPCTSSSSQPSRQSLCSWWSATDGRTEPMSIGFDWVGSRLSASHWRLCRRCAS